MSRLSPRSRVYGVDNSAKNLASQAIRNGQDVTLDQLFSIDQQKRNEKSLNLNKDIILDRDFANLQMLNPSKNGPQLVHSRGTGATQINKNGEIEFSPENLFTRSEEFDNASWVKGGDGPLTITANQAISPTGELTADKLIGTFISSGRSLFQNVAVMSTTQTLSIWMRTNAGTRSMRLFINDSQITSDVTVTTTWQRFTLSGAVSGTLMGGGRCGIRNLQTLDETNHVFIWGAQLERHPFARNYNKTISQQYYGPRFTHDPVTLEPLGLLIEPSATNFLTYSKTLQFQSVFIYDGDYTFSFTGTGTVVIESDDSSILIALDGTGDGEANRVSVNFYSVFYEGMYLNISVSGTVTNAQLEYGVNFTSYIPTFGVSATRGEDFVYISGQSFFRWFTNQRYTMFLDFSAPRTFESQIITLSDPGITGSQSIEFFSTISGYECLVILTDQNGSSTAFLNALIFQAQNKLVLSSKIDSNTGFSIFNMSLNGSLQASEFSTVMTSDFDYLRLVGRTFKKLTFYSRFLTEAEADTLSAI